MRNFRKIFKLSIKQINYQLNTRIFEKYFQNLFKQFKIHWSRSFDNLLKKSFHQINKKKSCLWRKSHSTDAVIFPIASVIAETKRKEKNKIRNFIKLPLKFISLSSKPIARRLFNSIAYCWSGRGSIGNLTSKLTLFFHGFGTCVVVSWPNVWLTRSDFNLTD